MSASEGFRPMLALPTKVRPRRFLNPPWGTPFKAPPSTRKQQCTPTREYPNADAVTGLEASGRRAPRCIRQLRWALIFAMPLSMGIASADENPPKLQETLTSLLAQRMGRAGGLTSTDV